MKANQARSSTAAVLFVALILMCCHVFIVALRTIMRLAEMISSYR